MNDNITSQQERIPAKAMGPEEQSDAIVVSFGAEWHKQLTAKQFSVVIRKRVPKSTSFKWLYFHVNSPIGAICARAAIKTIFTATAKEAVKLAGKINLTPEEITEYIGNDASIGCYEIARFQFAKASLTTAVLGTRLTYYAPQSFFILSKPAKLRIDQMAVFSSSVQSKLKK